MTKLYVKIIDKIMYKIIRKIMDEKIKLYRKLQRDYI